MLYTYSNTYDIRHISYSISHTHDTFRITITYASHITHYTLISHFTCHIPYCNHITCNLGASEDALLGKAIQEGVHEFEGLLVRSILGQTHCQ